MPENNGSLVVSGAAVASEVYSIADDRPSPFDELAQKELEALVRYIMKDFSADEKTVIGLRFGLGGGRCYTFEEISFVINLGKESVRRIEEKALSKIRKQKLSVELINFYFET